MSIMIAVDILGCTGSTEERAALLHKTIQLAAELKSTMGNMFSFAAVMNALEMAQVRGCCLRPRGLGSAHFLNAPCPHGPPLGWEEGDHGPVELWGHICWGVSREEKEPSPLWSRQPVLPGCDCLSVVGLFVLCWVLFLRGNESTLQYNTNQSQGRGSSVSGPHCSLWKMKD